MITARFSIGIDLGTTNSALAFVPLNGQAKSEIFEIAQREAVSEITEFPALPSFLYLPDKAAAQMLGGAAGKEQWIVGRFARKKGGETPDRVIHSAKSWLCHHTSDRLAGFLPWGSDDIARDRKISPVRASALILNHLKEAWNSRFAVAGAEFDDQKITIAVPASFDAAAQRLTLMAAQEAGFPATVRLLEEPQATFHCWLEQYDFVTELQSKLPDAKEETHHVLVVDIGGGTSDFSLFEFRSDNRSPVPRIKRQAVGDHILLGGDNVDLAIAHFLEPRLIGDRGKLSGPQWEDLVGRCRDLKEQVLSSEGRPDEAFFISLPGRGSDLIAASRTAQLTRGEVQAVLLDGFFPECSLQASPYRTQAALKEWGLPYASDCAITRHLADFLRGRASVDAILFNGGSLRPEFLRRRICRLIGNWQGGLTPLALENADPDLAVARGAALFGKSAYCKTGRIEAGAARAVFLEVARAGWPEGAKKARPSLVCVLPHGASSELRFDVAGLGLEVQTNRLARFQAYYSTRHDSCRAGDIVDWREEEFRALPPLETIITVAGSPPGTITDTLPVNLITNTNELGLLEVACVSADAHIKQSWRLEFNLRPNEQDRPSRHQLAAVCNASVHTNANVSTAALEAARKRIQYLFAESPKPKDVLTAARVLRNLEQILGMPKSEWNAGLVRSLWPTLESCIDRRKQSPDHEEAWLILAGFLLRPGFGATADNFRIDSLWRLRDNGLYFPGKRNKCQEFILWRRVAGGLTQERQEQILVPELDKVRIRKKPVSELILLVGSLERVPNETKAELANLFIDITSNLAREKRHCAPYLGALSHILSRAPLYAGPETVVSPDLVERAYGTFRRFDWAAPELAQMQTLFLRAARVVGDRSLDLPKALRYRIASKLEESGVTRQKTAKLKEFTPLGPSERISLHDESLPPGLILTDV
jgi:molecular chaperone DnaK (HSP70)